MRQRPHANYSSDNQTLTAYLPNRRGDASPGGAASDQKTILFVYRRFMDLDNLLPVAWRMAREPGCRILFLSMNPALDISSDERLCKLARASGIETGFLLSAWSPTLLHRLSVAVLLKFTGARRLPLMPQLVSAVLGRCMVRLFDLAWCLTLFRQNGVVALVMDWAKLSQQSTKLLTDAARHLGIPSFALPHGVDKSRDPIYYRRLTEGIYDHFDMVVTPNSIRRDLLISAGMSPDRVISLGSARFCTEWETAMAATEPDGPELLPDAKGRLKVVYFDPVARSGELPQTLRRIANLPFVKLVVKPKPGAKEKAVLAEALAGSDAIMGAELSSFSLCKWADVIVGTETGILLEAFPLRKHLIYLRYLDDMVPLYDTMHACQPATDIDHLVDILNTIHREPMQDPVSDDNRQAFMKEVICGDSPSTDILGEYTKLILRTASSSITARSTAEKMLCGPLSENRSVEA
jgi:hypothetical protein